MIFGTTAILLAIEVFFVRTGTGGIVFVTLERTAVLLPKPAVEGTLSALYSWQALPRKSHAYGQLLGLFLVSRIEWSDAFAAVNILTALQIAFTS